MNSRLVCQQQHLLGNKRDNLQALTRETPSICSQKEVVRVNILSVIYLLLFCGQCLDYLPNSQVQSQVLASCGCQYKDGISCVCVRICACPRVFEPDALLTGAGPGAAVSHCFPWQRLAAPRGPCHKGSSVTHQSALLCPKLPPWRGEKTAWQISRMHNVNEQNDSCLVQKFRAAYFTNAACLLVTISAK